jgi:hypothetical protein
MAINSLQIPQIGTITPDITPTLANLVNTINQGQQRQTLADLGRGLADGTIDYKQAAGKLASTGDLASTLSLLKLGQEQEASKAFSSSLGSLYGGGAPAPAVSPSSSGDPRGIRNNNPLNLEASSFTQKQPGFTGSDGRFGRFGSMDQGLAAADKLLQSYGQRGINTVGGIINRWAPANDGNPVSAYAQFVARKAGVDPNAPIDMNDPATRQRIVGAMAEFENGRPVQVASNDPAALPANSQPTQGFAIPGQAQQSGISPRAIQLMRMMSMPGISANERETGGKLLAAELDQSKLPDAVKQYVFAKSQDPSIGSFTDWTRGNKAAGKTEVNVDTKGQNAFATEGGQVIAKRFAKLSEEGDTATQDLALVGQLRDIGTRIKTGGTAAVQGTLANYGIKIGDNVGEVEAYNSIIDKLTPSQRVPGSGATSDYEGRMFKNALPKLINTPQGNEIISNTLAGLAQSKIDRARIAEAALAGDITPSDAMKQLRALPSPYENFKAFQKSGFKADPNAPAQSGTTTPQSSPSTPPIRGARKAPDGKWYIQRGDKYFRVDQ